MLESKNEMGCNLQPIFSLYKSVVEKMGLISATFTSTGSVRVISLDINLSPQIVKKKSCRSRITCGEDGARTHDLLAASQAL